MSEANKNKTSNQAMHWEMGNLNEQIGDAQPGLEHIQVLAENIAETRGRKTFHDPLLLLLKKFFTGDWRKKMNDQDEASELIEEMNNTLERVPLQYVLRVIKILGRGQKNLGEKLIELRKEITQLSEPKQAKPSHEQLSSLNQLIGDLESFSFIMDNSIGAVEIEDEFKVEIAQEISDFVYMLAKLKNVSPEKFPNDQQLEELFKSCGGFSYQDAITFCYYKYGSRLAREKKESGAGKNKNREKEIMTNLLRKMEKEGELEFELSEINIETVQKKLREILFEIIGVPERMVVTCDLSIYGEYQGRQVKLVIPRKQNFIEERDGKDVVTFCNLMTTAKVGNHEKLETILNDLPTGSLANETEGSDPIINGYKIEKGGTVLRIQGIPTEGPESIEAITQLQTAVENSKLINFSADIVLEAFVGLGDDVEKISTIMKSIMEKKEISESWQSYDKEIIRMMIQESNPRYIQTIPSINNFKSGRTGHTTNALSVRGQMEVSEKLITSLIEAGKAEFVDTNTTVITAPILILEADRKSGLLFELATKIDNQEKMELPHSIELGETRLGENGPFVAVSTNSLN